MLQFQSQLLNLFLLHCGKQYGNFDVTGSNFEVVPRTTIVASNSAQSSEGNLQLVIRIPNMFPNY